MLRIEDIDPPREPLGADKLILDALELYGFEWDGPVIRQSKTSPLHNACIEELLGRGLAYRCSCSRRDLADAPQGVLGTIYPGTCRRGHKGSDYSVRIRTNSIPVAFTDDLQGPLEQDLERESGDFIIKRRDGLIGYNLAVVVDDQDQGITEIIRGIDLFESTPRHIYLQRQLGFRTPAYLHIPVAVNLQGQKLSKLTGATAIPLGDPVGELYRALNALRQSPPPDLSTANLSSLWDWAVDNWEIARLRGLASIPAQ